MFGTAKIGGVMRRFVRAAPWRSKPLPQVEILQEETSRSQPPTQPLQTDAERDEANRWIILQLRKSGRSPAFIADEFKMTPNDVRRVLSEAAT